ncbi:MAG: acylphosphatase [Lachnospiraceae bacterium]|nr:acylphosphatase [Lachnospiraceae bacterium]
MVRKHLIARGRVQGVGFRYVCSSIANEYHLTGWVRNCYDGSVEIEVQGPEHRVDGFTEKLRKGNRFIKIRQLDVAEIPPLRADAEDAFRIRHYE